MGRRADGQMGRGPDGDIATVYSLQTRNNKQPTSSNLSPG